MWKYFVLTFITQFHEDANCQTSTHLFAETISAVQKLFNSGCLYTFVDLDNEDLSYRILLKDLEKLLMEKNIQNTIVENKFIAELHCRSGRPLHVAYYSSNLKAYQLTMWASFTYPRWLLFLPEDEDITDIFREVHVPLDCEFYVTRLMESEVQIWEVYRVHASDTLEVHTVGSWSLSNGLQWTHTSLYDRRANLNGMVFTVVFTNLAFMRNVTNEAGQIMGLAGGIFSLWKDLERALNFTTKFSKYIPEWGVRLENGSWNGMIGAVQSNEADTALGGFTMTSSRMDAVDFLEPFVDAATMVFIKKPNTWDMKWNIHLEPFKWSLWVIILGVIVLFGIGLTITAKFGYLRNKRDTAYQNIYTSILCVASNFCGQGQDSIPNSKSGRILFLTSSLASVVLLGSYSGSLISFLTVQKVILPFNSFEGLLKDGTYNLHLLSGVEFSYFKESNDPLMTMIYEKLIKPDRNSVRDDMTTLLNDLCNIPRTAAFMTSLTNSIPVECDVIGLPNVRIPGALSLIMNKESHYKGLFNYYIQKMRYNGILKRIHNVYWHMEREENATPITETTIKAVVPLHVVLTLGILISICVLIIEHLLHRLSRNSKLIN